MERASAPTPYDEARAGTDTRLVRAWALQQGIQVAPKGGLPRFVYELYRRAHPGS
ncbi:Lsr2 family DNA-binding protein [Nocardioides lianchengensis]|uniref:Lsr2 protein n=1 Tax=Nocardioides lianchengensis TaxID=1045774 RepID=A0A1G7A1L3_9ACTN|nr:Lsr2 family protein [Nocardioides lianchengensis]NYG12289.1 hypothetical protein [Nocardioides lianchengensis]SDE07776.1 Lsr2 protein [Nocardioides lianchengensis]